MIVFEVYTNGIIESSSLVSGFFHSALGLRNSSLLLSIALFFIFWHDVVFYYIKVPSFHHLFFHSIVDGHLGCFQFGAIMNDTPVNFLVLVSWCTWDVLQLGVHLGGEVVECGVGIYSPLVYMPVFQNR